MGGAVSTCCGLCRQGGEPAGSSVEALEDVEFDTLLDTDTDQHQSWDPNPLTAEEIQRITQLKMQQVAEEEQRLEQQARQWEEEERRLELEEQALYERQRQAALARKAQAPRGEAGLGASDSDLDGEGEGGLGGDDDFESFLDNVRSRTLQTTQPPAMQPHTPPTQVQQPQGLAFGSLPPSPVHSPAPPRAAAGGETEEGEEEWGGEWDDGGALASTLQATASLMGDSS